MAFDYFVGRLECSKCGETSQPNGKTNIQTKMRKTPDMSELAVGDVLDADWADVEEAGYIRIQETSAPNDLRILETWDCPTCGAPFNWAIVSIVGGVIQSVETARLEESVILGCDWITDECLYLLPDEVTETQAVQCLIKSLPTN